jgi:hypothetical protein
MEEVGAANKTIAASKGTFEAANSGREKADFAFIIILALIVELLIF